MPVTCDPPALPGPHCGDAGGCAANLQQPAGALLVAWRYGGYKCLRPPVVSTGPFGPAASLRLWPCQHLRRRFLRRCCEIWARPAAGGSETSPGAVRRLGGFAIKKVLILHMAGAAYYCTCRSNQSLTVSVALALAKAAQLPVPAKCCGHAASEAWFHERPTGHPHPGGKSSGEVNAIWG